MIFLRIISFLAGSFVLLASPFVLLSQRQGLAPSGEWGLVAGSVVVALFALAYFHVALFAHRCARSPRVRQLGAALLGFQLVAGAAFLATSRNPQALVSIAPLLCYSVVLFLAFVFPGEMARNHRPMRRRDHSDHYLSS